MTGWTRLLRLALRRDRVLLPVWVVALALVCASAVRATVDLYGTPGELLAAGRAVNGSPALVALYGPLADPGSPGGVATFKLLLLGGVFVALLGVVVVRRHTRLEEESGRAELLVAAGRHALLVAAVGVAVLASVLVGVLAGLACVAGGLPVAGSVAFGAAWCGLGVSATGLTAVAAQLSASTRTVGVVVGSVLGGGYVLRAAGDLGRSDGWDWLTWLSPFGWVTRQQVFGTQRWWVLVLPAALLMLSVALAAALASRRDLGEGLLASRPGRAHGRLAGVGALTLRQQRGAVVGSTLAVAAVGVLLGAILPSVSEFAGSASVRQVLRRVGGAGRLDDTFLATEISFVAVGLAAMGVVAVVRLAGEEEDGRVAAVLATATSRSRVLGTTAAVAVAWPTLAALAFGLATSLTVGRQLVGAAAAQLPAVWLVTALALLLLALRRSWAVLGWGLLALFLLLGQVGDLLGLPHWLLALSPFEHVPTMPTEGFAWAPEVALTLIALAVGVVALRCYREREIAG